MGWSMIGVTTINIAVNMIVVGYQTFRNLKMQLRYLVYKFKLWRYHRNQETIPLKEQENEENQENNVEIKKKKKVKV
jgi:hypothetical protein